MFYVPKPPDPTVSRHLRRLLLDWLAQDASRTEVDFARAAGLSKATVNTIKNKAEGGGSRTVRGFARALGLSPLEIYARPKIAQRPFFRGSNQSVRFSELLP